VHPRENPESGTGGSLRLAPALPNQQCRSTEGRKVGRYSKFRVFRSKSYIKVIEWPWWRSRSRDQKNVSVYPVCVWSAFHRHAK